MPRRKWSEAGDEADALVYARAPFRLITMTVSNPLSLFEPVIATLKQQFSPAMLRKSLPLWLVIALTGLLVLQPALTELLRYDRELFVQGEWWRLITANVVHSNGWHWLLNVLSILVQYLLFADTWRAPRWWLIAMVCTPLNILGMHLFTDINWYVGLSGALYGTAICGSVALLCQREWRVGGVLFVYLNGRIVYEQLTGSPQDLAVLIEAPVAIDAHLWGLISGYLALALIYVGHKLARSR
ncbi:rhomboid family GlyGly-CTERM serine protease [Permianibacter aggregans]|uniref:Rhomboid family GlyGly-CTERM serine protease n=2 Tax=Permianibacter aggregans TaxID=1510150 RepID=A0A4V3D6H0_9GAMM|nr:rhomboid family GlyGly-CTERM serine protease [Permianibacter aggregans]